MRGRRHKEDATMSDPDDTGNAPRPEDDDVLVADDSLVEEVSIDGMCGVY